MGNPRKINLEKFRATSVTRKYYLRHKVTGEYAHGVFYQYVLETVPGKKRRQRMYRSFVCGSMTPSILDIEDVNKIIERAVEKNVSHQLDDFELLAVDRVVGMVPVGKLDLKKKKEAAEMALLAAKLKGTA